MLLLRSAKHFRAHGPRPKLSKKVCSMVRHTALLLDTNRSTDRRNPTAIIRRAYSPSCLRCGHTIHTMKHTIKQSESITLSDWIRTDYFAIVVVIVG